MKGSKGMLAFGNKVLFAEWRFATQPILMTSPLQYICFP